MRKLCTVLYCTLLYCTVLYVGTIAAAAAAALVHNVNNEKKKKNEKHTNAGREIPRRQQGNKKDISFVIDVILVVHELQKKTGLDTLSLFAEDGPTQRRTFGATTHSS